MDDKLINQLNQETNKVVNLLSFLIEFPDLATQLTGIHKERIQSMNLLRLAIAEFWIEEMKKKLEKNYGNEVFNKFDKIKSLLEVNK